MASVWQFRRPSADNAVLDDEQVDPVVVTDGPSNEAASGQPVEAQDASGDTQQGDDEAVVGEWHPPHPPVGTDVTRLAEILLQHEAHDPTTLVQPDGTLWQLTYTAATIGMTAVDFDARVTPLAEIDDGDLADLLQWVVRRHAAQEARAKAASEVASSSGDSPSNPTPAPPPRLTPGAWRALHSDHWLTRTIRAHHQLETACLLYDGAGEVRTWAARADLTLVDLRWDEPDNTLGWRLVRWLRSSDEGWKAVRAIVPARSYLHRLILGEARISAGIVEDLADLAQHPAAVNVGLLIRLAPALDDLAVAHGIRHGQGQALPEGEGHLARIELTQDGLLWHLPTPDELAEVELIRLAFGTPASVVPESLKRVCIQALQASECEVGQALWWWQRGAHVSPDEMSGTASLSRALTWAEMRTSTLDAVLPAALLSGLLKLAGDEHNSAGALGAECATRLCTVVGGTGASGSIALQTLALASPEDRPALLRTAGLSLTSMTHPPLHILDVVEPRLIEVPHGE